MARSQNKKWTPVLKEKTADQRKREELHGKTSQTHACGKKGDAALMSSASDWRNPTQKHTQGAERRNQEQGGCFSDSKTKKHQNLESSNVFGNAEAKFDKKNVPFDKLTNPTDKVINKGSTKVDTYAKR